MSSINDNQILFFDILPKELNIIILFHLNDPVSLYEMKSIFPEILLDDLFWSNKINYEFPFVYVGIDMIGEIESQIINYTKIKQSYDNTKTILTSHIKINGNEMSVSHRKGDYGPYNLKRYHGVWFEVLCPESAYNVNIFENPTAIMPKNILSDARRSLKVTIPEEIRKNIFVDLLTNERISLHVFTNYDEFDEKYSQPHHGIYYQISTDDKHYIYLVKAYDLFNLIFMFDYLSEC